MYKIFPTEKEANEANHQKVLDMGYEGAIQYWWLMIKHPTDGQYALVVAEGDFEGLSSHKELRDNGWFPGPKDFEVLGGNNV